MRRIHVVWSAVPAVSVFLLASGALAVTNDNFADATVVTGAVVHASGSNVGATTEPGEPNRLGEASHSVWWRWTACPTYGPASHRWPTAWL